MLFKPPTQLNNFTISIQSLL